jgi:hypothetical protein
MFITIFGAGAAWHYGYGSGQMMRSGSATLVSTLWRIAKGSSGSKTARGTTLWRIAKGSETAWDSTGFKTTRSSTKLARGFI